VDPRARLDDMKLKFLTLPGLELLPVAVSTVPLILPRTLVSTGKGTEFQTRARRHWGANPLLVEAGGLERLTHQEYLSALPAIYTTVSNVARRPFVQEPWNAVSE
jgi:hypothetical protein